MIDPGSGKTLLEAVKDIKEMFGSVKGEVLQEHPEILEETFDEQMALIERIYEGIAAAIENVLGSLESLDPKVMGAIVEELVNSEAIQKKLENSPELMKLIRDGMMAFAVPQAEMEKKEEVSPG